MSVAMASGALMRTAATAVGTPAAIVTASPVASTTARGMLHPRAVIILDARVPGLLFLGRLIFGCCRVAVSGRPGIGCGIGTFVLCG